MDIKELTNASLRIANNFPPALITSLQSLALINPAFIPLAVTVQSIIGYYGDYSTSKTLDLFEDFLKNKDEIIFDVVQTDKFKASFLRIIGDNITEGNEDKRVLLKNYIINFASGVEQNFDEHTKLINVLSDITIDEVLILGLWADDGFIKLNPSYKNIGRITIGEIKSCALDRISIVNGKHHWGKKEKYIFEMCENKDKLNQILLSLGYKDLLYVLSENNFGSGEEARVKDITSFGKTFLRFISK